MKNHIILIITFCTLLLGANAQETIELDGMKIDLNKLTYNKPYQVDSTIDFNILTLKSKDLKNTSKSIEDKIYTSKGYKSFVKSTLLEKIDSTGQIQYDSDLKFFDSNGILKWEKKMERKAQQNCLITHDGSYLIVKMAVFNSSDIFDQHSTLVIYDQYGNTVLDNESPVNFSLANSRDIICYQQNHLITGNDEDKKKVFCFDLKSKKGWYKTFMHDVEVKPISSNGDYIQVFENNYYIVFNRKGVELFRKHRDELGQFVRDISCDGKFILSLPNPIDGETFFHIYDTKKFNCTKIQYPDNIQPTHKIFNGGSFVKNAKYVLALTTIIKPNTGALMLFDTTGKYLGHEIYSNIKSSFWYPDVSLGDNGIFEVYIDGDFMGNLVLPNVNTLKYLKI